MFWSSNKLTSILCQHFKIGNPKCAYGEGWNNDNESSNLEVLVSSSFPEKSTCLERFKEQTKRLWCPKIPKWRCPKIGLFLVVIHLRFGFSPWNIPTILGIPHDSGNLADPSQTWRQAFARFDLEVLQPVGWPQDLKNLGKSPKCPAFTMDLFEKWWSMMWQGVCLNLGFRIKAITFWTRLQVDEFADTHGCRIKLVI